MVVSSVDNGADSQSWKPIITLVASLIVVDNNFFVASFDGDFAFRSLGRKRDKRTVGTKLRGRVGGGNGVKPGAENKDYQH